MKNEDALGRSFINNKKRIGPRIEPWGTPYLMNILDDEWLFKKVNWDLDSRYDLKKDNIESYFRTAQNFA